MQFLLIFTHFYKVIAAVDSEHNISKVISFILPNSSTPSDKLPEFVVSVDKVESLTSFDFFNQLEDGIENELEKIIPKMW